MPKYQVVGQNARIEHNGVLFVPKTYDGPDPAPTSGSNMNWVNVDRSGVIELTEPEAAHIVEGILHPDLPVFNGKPDPIGAAEGREKKDQQDAAAAAGMRAAVKAQYEEFLAFKAAKAAKKK